MKVAAVVPGKPDDSYLMQLITPVDGAAEMPKGKKPLAQSDLDLIRNWIGQGATDDTPENAKQHFDMDHPPVYSRPPMITSIDFSPDGQWLAIAGFHEVLIHPASGGSESSDGTGPEVHIPVARLVGVSDRIESVRFSPDSKRIVVAAGLPERMGELQIWGLKSPESSVQSPEPGKAGAAGDSQPATLDSQRWTLDLSVPLTYDTIYGASWSPDGTLVAVGCGDKTVRAFDSTTGKQVFFSGAHDDWALDTTFSVDGSQIVSVGRDMTTKLYEVATQRFIDNVSSITPGALKGGITTLTRHPQRDEILIGGADGVPRIYRMNRLTKRVIGDDANLIRQFPQMNGRIFSGDFAPDGKRIVCGSSLDGAGQVWVFSSDYDGTLTRRVEKDSGKTPADLDARRTQTG